MSKKKLDFTNVESYTRMEEGVHKVKIVSCEDKTTQAGDDMLTIAFESIAGLDKGSRVFDNFVLTDKALWKLKQLLQALGIKCDGKIALDTDKLIGKVCEATIFHEEYNGQQKARVDEYMKLKSSGSDDDEDEEEEENKPEPKAKKSAPVKAKKPEPKDEEDDDDWDDDEEEEEPAPKKPTKPETKKPAPKKKKSEPEPEEDDDDDDDDEDWEEA